VSTGLDHVALDLETLSTRTSPWRDGWTGCLLHGFGASAQDLVSLAPALGGARRWLFPHAPIPISFGGMAYGRAWFPRDTGDLERAVYGGYFLSLRGLEPEGLADAAAAVRDLLLRQGVDWSTLVLGGFSQGAMVTAELLRQGLVDPGLPMPRAALLFSGALVAESWWRGVDASTRGTQLLPSVFQSHGTDDPVLPLSEGEALRDVLSSAGLSVSWRTFPGRHEIPSAAVEGARALVDGVSTAD